MDSYVTVMLVAQIDKLLQQFPHCHFVTSPVFGPPAVADAGNLVIAMSGDYPSKQEVAHLLVPGVGRKVIDLGGNIEKGRVDHQTGEVMENKLDDSSSHFQVDRKRTDHGCQRVTCRDAHSWRKIGYRGPRSEQFSERYLSNLTIFEVSHPCLEIMPAPRCAPYLLLWGQRPM